MEWMIDVAGSHFAHCTLEVFAQAMVTMEMCGHKCFLVRNVHNYMSDLLAPSFTDKNSLTKEKLRKN